MKVGTSESKHSWLRPRHRITAGILLFIALIVSGHLVYMKLTGQISSLRGCGGIEGCANLLGGRWANWFGVPISALAFAIYAVLMGLIIRGGTKKTRIALTLFGGMLLFLAAAWFLFLQVFVEHYICVYCMFLHACGVAVFCILLSVAITCEFPGKRAVLQTAVSATIAGIAFLILGQVYGPQPASHSISEVAVSNMRLPTEAGHQLPDRVVPASQQVAAPSTTETPALLNTPPRTVSYMDGHVRYTLGEVPLIGNPAAKHIVVKYFDYTCPGCRDLHLQLEIAMAVDPQKFAVIVIPTPLHRGCNPYVPVGVAEHPGACELAKLGLAVWRANSGKFSAFHEKLLREQNSISVPEARKFAAELVGETALTKAENDPSISATLDQAISIYRVLSRSEPRLPKLLLGGKRLVNGIPRDAAALEKLLNDAFVTK